MSNSNLLYPPVKVVRQNQTHIFRILIRSEDMIDFLKNNYAIPLNRDKPYCYFDINLSKDKSKLVASTDSDKLEVVGGDDNPNFNRPVKQIVKLRKGQRKEGKFEPNITTLNKEEITDRTKNENQIFIGQVTNVLPLEKFTKRNGEVAASRYIIVEHQVGDYTQQGLFEIYRKGRFIQDIDENFMVNVGDLIKVEYFMHLMEWVNKEGVTKYIQKNKVYRWHFMMDKVADDFDPRYDNPWGEEIDVSKGVEFLSNLEKKRLMQQKQ